MKDIYHYKGMRLHYLTADESFVVYRRKCDPNDPPKVRFIPFVVFRIERKYSIYSGWHISHKKIDAYADLNSAVIRANEEMAKLWVSTSNPPEEEK